MLRINDKIKILIVSANPETTRPLRLEQEKRDIEEALMYSPKRDSFMITTLSAARLIDLRKILVDPERTPNILHFCGHGGSGKGLIFEDHDGKAKYVQGDDLAGLLSMFTDSLDCVVLNACYSEVQAYEIHKHINCVIGIEEAIGDKSAIAFVVAFYEALFAGRQYQFSYDYANRVVKLDSELSIFKPILLLREMTITNSIFAEQIYEGMMHYKELNKLSLKLADIAAYDNMPPLFVLPTNPKPYLDAIESYHNRNTPAQLIAAEIGLEKENKLKTKLEINGNPVDFDNVIKELKKENLLLITGPGGAGKTFMLLNSVVQLLKSNRDEQHFIYIALNDINFNNNDESIEKYINEKIFKTLPNWKNVYYHNSSTEIRFLFDGFNELPQNALLRKKCAKEILKFSTDYNSKVVIASRYEDTLDSILPKNAVRAKVCDLTEDDIVQYLENKSKNINAELMEVLRNPLMLTLYAKTSRFVKVDKSSAPTKRLCRWIPPDKIIYDSEIIWNYLCCEVLKVEPSDENSEQIRILTYLSIRFIWPRIAYYMHVNNSFFIDNNAFNEVTKITLQWIKTQSHRELERISSEASNFKLNQKKYSNYIQSLDQEEVCFRLKDAQTFFEQKETDDGTRYKFYHQSMRDALAAVHLLNIAPTQENFGEWNQISFSENIYMLRHLSKLTKSFELNHGEKILDGVRSSLVGREIPKNDETLKNLLLIYNQKIFLNGDFTNGFDFKHLDLRYCDLTDYKVSDDKTGKGASFHYSTIGVETFKLPSHSRKIMSIAVSSDGCKVLSCGEDCVLLWNFGDRSIEKELHRFDERNNIDNQVAFSSDDKYALFTDGKKLFDYDLDTGVVVEYTGAEESINGIIATKFKNEINYYFAMDVDGTIWRWRQGKKLLDGRIGNITALQNEIFMEQSQKNKGMESGHEDHDSMLCLLAPTYDPHRFLACDKNDMLILVDDNLNTIDKYDIVHTGGDIAISCDENFFAIATIKQNNKNRQYINSFKIVNIYSHETQEISVTDSDNVIDIAISFTLSENRLVVMIKTIDGDVTALFYQKIGSRFEPIKMGEVSLGKAITTNINTSLFQGDYIFYADYDKIIVSKLKKNSSDYRGCTKLDNHLPFVNSICFSQTNGQLYAAYEDGNVREWNYYEGTPGYNYKKRRNASAMSVTVAHSDNLIASSDSEGYIMLWDSDERRFIGDVGNVSFVTEVSDIDKSMLSFSRDDKYIIAITENGVVSVWNANTNTSENGLNNNLLFDSSKYKRKRDMYVCSSLHYYIGDEQRIILGYSKGNLASYRLNYEKKEVELLFEKKAHHKSRILSLALSPDSSKFISYGEDSFVREWDAETTDEDRLLMNEIRINGGALVNASSCQYSQDGLSIYCTINMNDDIQVVEIPILGPKPMRSLYAMDRYYYKNEGIIKRKGNHIISGDLCGKIYYYDVVKSICKEMIVNAMSSKKIENCEGFDMANYDPKHLRETYVQKGADCKLREWLQKGIVPNLIALASCSELDNVIAGDIGALSISEKTHEISKLFILSTFGNRDAPSAGECLLLETSLLYICSEAPPDEQNMMMVCELFRAGYADTSSNRTDLSRLFEILREKKKRSSNSTLALSKWDSYLKEFGDNNRAICESLLERLDSLNIIYKKDGKRETGFLTYPSGDWHKIPRIAEDKIIKMAYSLACNSDEGSISCPTYFCESDEAQVLCLQIILTYLNTLSDEQRTSEKAAELFKNTVMELLHMSESITSTEMKTLIMNLQSYEAMYSNVEKKNYFILSFWNEFK